MLAIYQLGVCYFCFDNFLFMMNIHTTTQFRILRHRLMNIDITSEEEHDLKGRISSSTEKCYITFKSYVRQHQDLIAYCENLEEVFSLIVLGQVLIFSLLICLDGCQVLLVCIRQLKLIKLNGIKSISLLPHCVDKSFTFFCRLTLVSVCLFTWETHDINVALTREY